MTDATQYELDLLKAAGYEREEGNVFVHSALRGTKSTWGPGSRLHLTPSGYWECGGQMYGGLRFAMHGAAKTILAHIEAAQLRALSLEIIHSAIKGALE